MKGGELRAARVRPRLAVVLLPAFLLGGSSVEAGTPLTPPTAIVTIYDAVSPRGLLATTGGWAYCSQARPIARQLNYTLVCGRYAQDGYTGPGLRAERWLDWGNPAYLDTLAVGIARVHRRVGGPLVMAGVSYSGYGVAVLAARHPELRPARVVVVDSYLDLAARRSRLPATHATAREIDRETGGTQAEIAARSPSLPGLVQLVRRGTKLEVVWSISATEREEFRGATCSSTANAGRLAALAHELRRPFVAWVTQSRHGVAFWRHGASLVLGGHVGSPVVFRPDGRIPPRSTCR